MRPFEIALVLGNLLTFGLLLVPRSGGTIWPVVAGLATAAIAIVQLLVEGSRWQMLPSYTITGVLLLASLLLWRLAPAGMPQWAPWQGLVASAGFVMIGLGLVIAIALPILVPMFEFPVPTGPHAIGTMTYHWVDRSRADFGDPTARRELMVQIWYPAQPSTGGQRDTYIEDSMHFSSLEGGMPFPGFFFNHLNDIHTHAVRSAPVAADGGRFPVIIFSPGAQGFRQHNTFEVEELVSHGYVVAGIDHPRAAREVVFPDGRRVEFDPKLVDVPRFMTDPAFADGIFNYLGKDVSFAIDQIAALDHDDPSHILTGRLDVDHIGMLGVSLGGLVGAEACRTDPRIKACLTQDVFVPQDVLAAGVAQPAMWLSSDAPSMRDEGWPPWEVDLHQNTMQAAYESTRSEGYRVRVPGMFHLNYTDFPYTVATPIGQGLKLIGPIDWRTGHRIVNAYALAFFDRHLEAKPAPLLDGPSPQFPGVLVESRHP